MAARHRAARRPVLAVTGPWGAWAVVVVVVLISAVAMAARASDDTQAHDPLDDWAVAPGFSLSVDKAGFELPAAIAFVPDPGDDPGDPLYFVAQLRGAIKVVTNDRTVHDFAELPTLRPEQELPATGAAQSGLAGICLDPENGYVFATFTHPDDRGILRNDLVRFATSPTTFGLTARDQVRLGGFLEPFQSAPAHQIGGCEVVDGSLFVSVGDGGNSTVAKDRDVLLGKILCLTVDGDPCPDNPFPGSSPSRYVWAYGFRNPFGIQVVDGNVFLAENGVDIDSFLVAERGQDHHWDGSDASIAAGADAVFSPAVSPVQMDFLPAGDGILPGEYDDHFFMATFNPPAGAFTVGWDFDRGEVSGAPRRVLEYLGDDLQHVTGLALGPDGLYVLPIIPGPDGTSSVLKLRYDPADEHRLIVGRVATGQPGRDLFIQKGCVGCHSRDGQGGGIGPALDRYQLRYPLTDRLNSQAYEQQVAEVDQLDAEPFASYREERQEVLAAHDRERTRTWIKYRLLEPRFDDPDAQMPDLGLTPAEAETLRDYLMGDDAVPTSLVDRVLTPIRQNTKVFAAGVVAGGGASLALAASLYVAARLWRRRRRRVDAPPQ